MVERVGFERFSFSVVTFSYDIIKSNRLEGCQGAEVVSSNPMVHLFLLWHYGIVFSSILTIVGQIQEQAKDGYWQNELDSLGIESKRKKELNDEEELENLAASLWQYRSHQDLQAQFFLFQTK